MHATKSFPNVEADEKMAVTTDELRSMLSCGRYTATKIGEAAEAKIQVGKRVLWNVDKVRTYLGLISG